MYIDEFIWLPNIIEKLIIKHRVEQAEAEDVFYDRPRYHFAEVGYQSGEDIDSASGQTEAGRYLVVFFIHKALHVALIISARDMDRKERKLYERS
jgi:uncharacterized DUF497 family protein